jgi:dihydroorotase
MPEEILFPFLFDSHVHFRTYELYKLIIKITGEFFRYATAMSNVPWIENEEDFNRHYQRFTDFADLISPELEVIPTIMLGKTTTPESLEEAFEAGARALKMIPGKTSTGADDHGISLYDLRDYYPVLKKAAELGLPFLGHWELRYEKDGREIPELLREKRAIPYLTQAVEAVPGTFIVEHVTTKEMLKFIRGAPENVYGTVTAHHMKINYDDVYQFGKIFWPENYCWPIAKYREDIWALIEAVTDPDNKKFFFGSDLAPHLAEHKTLVSPKAGVFCPGEVAIPMIWQIFVKKLGLTEQTKISFKRFMLDIGMKAYNLIEDFNEDEPRIKLVKETWEVPLDLYGIPWFWGGKKLDWKVKRI